MSDLRRALDSKESEVRELKDKVSSLRQDARRFRMRSDQAKETRSKAVEAAVARARKHYKSAETKKVKHPDGRIEDWVRNLVVELVALDGVPTAKVPQVIERVRNAFIQKEAEGEGEGEGSNRGDDDGDV